METKNVNMYSIQLQIPPVCCNGLVIFANTNILIY